MIGNYPSVVVFTYCTCFTKSPLLVSRTVHVHVLMYAVLLTSQESQGPILELEKRVDDCSKVCVWIPLAYSSRLVFITYMYMYMYMWVDLLHYCVIVGTLRICDV